MAGVHISRRTGLGATMRFPDGEYYAMSPSYRKKGIFPIRWRNRIQMFQKRSNVQGESTKKYIRDMREFDDM